MNDLRQQKYPLLLAEDSSALRTSKFKIFVLKTKEPYFPLRIDGVGKLFKTVMPLIMSSDITEDGMVIGVVG